MFWQCFRRGPICMHTMCDFNPAKPPRVFRELQPLSFFFTKIQVKKLHKFLKEVYEILGENRFGKATIGEMGPRIRLVKLGW